MVIGLGVDVFEVSRMERALREGDAGFAASLFTCEEIEYCAHRPDPACQFAASFAAKEAVLKALSVSDSSPTHWHDVELRAAADGTRAVVLHGALKTLARKRGACRVLLSLSCSPSLAAARAILESEHD
jgi:holo-[acyl-carrier protein] synthase